MKKILFLLVGIIISMSILAQDRGDRKAEKEIDKYYFNATNHYFFHQYDSAIIKLDILDFLYEDNSNIKFFLGMCYFFKGDFDKAIECYEDAVDIGNIFYMVDYQNGKYTPHVIYFYLAFSYEKTGNIDNAIKYYIKYRDLEKEENIKFNMDEKIEMLKLIYNKKD